MNSVHYFFNVVQALVEEHHLIGDIRLFIFFVVFDGEIPDTESVIG